MSLIWELVKNNNSFLRKNLNGTILSAEPGNLYNKHSFKYSGLANEKTIDIQAVDIDGSDKKQKAVKITKSRPKMARFPAKAAHPVISKKNARKILTSVAKEVSGFRPDLKAAALARLSAVHKSIRVQQAAAKKSS